MSRLLEEYNKQIKQELKSRLGFKNVFEVPKLKKIILQVQKLLFCQQQIFLKILILILKLLKKD